MLGLSEMKMFGSDLSFHSSELSAVGSAYSFTFSVTFAAIMLTLSETLSEILHILSVTFFSERPFLFRII